MTKLCLIPVSGGKDSQACMALAVDKFGPDQCLGIHQNTLYDHPLTYAHMQYMEKHYGVEIIHITSTKYPKGLPQLMEETQTIFGRMARLCTRELKLDPWNNWLAKVKNKKDVVVYLGMRAAESRERAASYGELSPDDELTMVDVDPKAKKAVRDVQVRMPIVHMTTPEVFRFLQDRGDKVNPLYARGHRRVGCYPCHLAGASDFRLAARDPVGRKHLQEAHRVIQIIKAARPELADLDQGGISRQDIPALLSLKGRDADPFNFRDEDEETSGCGWCQQ